MNYSDAIKQAANMKIFQEKINPGELHSGAPEVGVLRVFVPHWRRQLDTDQLWLINSQDTGTAMQQKPAGHWPTTTKIERS